MVSVLLFISLAAPGDAIYIVSEGKVVLSTPQKLELSSAVASSFDSVAPGTMDKYSCWSNPPAFADKGAIDVAGLGAKLPWPCYAIDANPTQSDDAALAYEVDSDGACKVRDFPGKPSDLLCERSAMDTDGKILNGAFVQSVFEKNMPLVWHYICERNPLVEGEIFCNWWSVKIANSTIWRADRKIQGKVVGTLGRVAP